MAIKTNKSSQKFFNQFYNGVGLDQNLTKFTNNLTGSVMEKVRVLTELEISWDILYVSPDNQPTGFEWELEYTGNDLKITRTDGGDFRDEGFAVDQNILFRAFTSVNHETDATIVSIAEDVIIINTPAWTALPISPAAIQLLGTEDLTAIRYDFGLIENDDNYNNNSLVTENSMGYYGVDIGLDSGGGRSTSFVNMVRIGEPKNWQTGSVRARFVENRTFLGTSTTIYQVFEIEHTFIIPYSTEPEITNILNDISPEYLIGDASLKYVFNADVLQVVSNPNIVYPVRDENTLGSVGFFNETFNGFANDYKINSITFEDANTTSSSDGLIISSKTKVTVSISRLSGVIAANEVFGVYVGYLAPQSIYDNPANTLVENFIYDNAIGLADGINFNGSDFIENVNGTVTIGVLTLTFEVEYSTAQKLLLSEQLGVGFGNYVIGIQVGDSSISIGNSDRVILSSTGLYDTNADIEGLIAMSNFKVYPHNENEGGTSYTDMTAWNEDGLLTTFDLDVDLAKSASISSLQFAIIAYNFVKERYFIINSVNIDLSQVILSGGVQQINFDSSRNYILKDGDQFNQLEVLTGARVSDIQSYNCKYSLKVPWQDWIRNLAVDSDFYDSTKPNDNLNLKTSNYSDKQNYSIHLAVISSMFGVTDLGVSGLTDYLILTPRWIVNDYNETRAANSWSGVIKTYRASNNEDLDGKILSGENTIFECTWTFSGGPVASLVDLWAIHRIEETGQPGFDIEELSSLRDYPTGQKLIPLTGSYLSLSLDSGNVVAKCLIDGSKIEAGTSYNISARIHNSAAVATNLKTTSPSDATKQTSGTVTNKTESTS